jgi:hypothetical protein
LNEKIVEIFTTVMPENAILAPAKRRFQTICGIGTRRSSHTAPLSSPQVRGSPGMARDSRTCGNDGKASSGIPRRGAVRQERFRAE